MIYAILENEVFWVRSETSSDRTQEYIEPEEWIFSSGLYSDYRKWKTELSIIMVWWDHDIRASILMYEKFCYMRTDRRFPYSPSNTYDIRFLDMYNQSCNRAEKKEKNRLHNRDFGK